MDVNRPRACGSGHDRGPAVEAAERADDGANRASGSTDDKHNNGYKVNQHGSVGISSSAEDSTVAITTTTAIWPTMDCGWDCVP